LPKPRKRKGETWSQYRNRLVRHYIDEGYPPKQAVAIAYSQTRKMQKEKKKKKKGGRRKK